MCDCVVGWEEFAAHAYAAEVGDGGVEHARGELDKGAVQGCSDHELVAGVQWRWGDDREAVFAEIGHVGVKF